MLSIKISVPYWSSLYFNDRMVELVQEIVENFRPLLEFFIFQYTMVKHMREISIISVPYWSSLYFNNTEYIDRKCAYEFPSPIGVLYISIKSLQLSREMLHKFPSPIGVLYISILSSAALIITGLQSRIAVQNLIRLFTI